MFCESLLNSPPQEGIMSDKKTTIKQTLEQQHGQLFKLIPEQVQKISDNESLEQPYVGEIVDSITTYSVYEKPIFNR